MRNSRISMEALVIGIALALLCLGFALGMVLSHSSDFESVNRSVVSTRSL